MLIFKLKKLVFGALQSLGYFVECLILAEYFVMQFLNRRFSKTLTNKGIELLTTPAAFPLLIEFGTEGAKRRVRAVAIVTVRGAGL